MTVLRDCRSSTGAPGRVVLPADQVIREVAGTFAIVVQGIPDEVALLPWV
jgi:hypothetical protein